MAEIIVVLKEIKTLFENTIISAVFNNESYSNGLEAKEALIRSQKLIGYLHKYVKEEFEAYGIPSSRICMNDSNDGKSELQLMGQIKQKKQDVCIIPCDVEKKEEDINWGVLQGLGCVVPYGFEFTERTIAINVRSQLSSLNKNVDTLFERTYAEPLNLHLRCENMCLGEVYMIPLYEYDDSEMKNNRVSFKKEIDFFKLNDLVSLIERTDVRIASRILREKEMLVVNGGKLPLKRVKDPEMLNLRKIILNHRSVTTSLKKEKK